MASGFGGIGVNEVPAEPQDYIFAQEKNRERTTIARLIASVISPTRDWFNPTLRWPLPFVWLGIRIPHSKLLTSFDRPPKKFMGDVDVLGATLEPSSVEENDEYLLRMRSALPKAHPTQIVSLTAQSMIADGKIKWPPNLSHISALEVKTAYFNASGDLKAAGDAYNGRHQTQELCEMGFDRVALARFVVTEPVDSGQHHPWIFASGRSGAARNEYLGTTKGVFVSDDDPYGTILISTGAVAGKLEHQAGEISGEWLRSPPENPCKHSASNIRTAVENNLLRVFASHEFPRTFPTLILACSNSKCEHLYVSGGNADARCPECGSQPR